MARWIILVSSLAAGAFANRLATNHVQHQKQAAASGPGILPGSVQAASPLRPAMMPQASAHVRMSTQEGRNPVKYPAKLRRKALDTAPNIWMIAEDDPELAAAIAEKQKDYKLNVLVALNSLRSDIPKVLQSESEDAESVEKISMNWDIYTDDLVTDFTNIVNPTALQLFTTMVPSWSASIKGKDLHKVVLQELREFVNDFADIGVVTGQDWCTEKDEEWCVLVDEVSGLDPELSEDFDGQPVITSSWKAELTMKEIFKQRTASLSSVGVHPAGVVTIQALSLFYVNDWGKIYRHSIDQLDIRLDQKSMRPEDAELW